MASLNTVEIDLSVRLGVTHVPIQQLLRMGRGAVIPLDKDVDSDVTLLANGLLIADAKVVLNDTNIAVEITYIHGCNRDSNETMNDPYQDKAMENDNSKTSSLSSAFLSGHAD